MNAPKDKSALGRRSRRKGARGELTVIAMIRGNLGLVCNRQLKQFQQSQEGDIEQLVGGFLLEVKNCAKHDLKAWWRQAVQAAEKRSALPCLAYKAARGRWKFVVPIPGAWATGHQWSREFQYTMALEPDGFYFLVRESSK